jgi:hypothetical protein
MALPWSAVLCLAACESGITVDMEFEVPDGVAAHFDTDNPGILQSSYFFSQVAPLCGDGGFTASAYYDGFGCRPDERDTTIQAWIVPIPESWDAGFCELAFDPEHAGLSLNDVLYPLEDLAAPSDEDPQGETDARWTSSLICGGALHAAIQVNNPG